MVVEEGIPTEVNAALLFFEILYNDLYVILDHVWKGRYLGIKILF